MDHENEVPIGSNDEMEVLFDLLIDQNNLENDYENIFYQDNEDREDVDDNVDGNVDQVDEIENRLEVNDVLQIEHRVDDDEIEERVLIYEGARISVEESD